MIFDLQNASLWKRISAWLFDFIMLGIVVVGVALLMSKVMGYEQYTDTMDAAYAKYEAQYDTDFEMTPETYDALTPEQKQAYEDAVVAMSKDEEAMKAFSMMANLSLVITSLSILAGYLILELIVPLFFGNGQTLGKKIFGIGVMRTDGVRISTVQLFIRTVLGKYTIETMIPVLVVMMIFFGFLGLPGTMLMGALALIQLILIIATHTNSLIHDCLAGTVVVDVASQMIFDTEEAMIESKKQFYAEQAARRLHVSRYK